MPDETPPDSDITASHPTARHLRAAEPPDGAGRPDPRPISATFPAEATLPHDVVSYGPDIPNERTYKLLGNVEGKRVLELGCGGGQGAIALAKQGAKVITVDPSAERLDRVRLVADREEVKIELHEGDLADLAFVRADTVDAVVSVYALATVDDPDRAFRQVHRVLSPEMPIVLSVPHPAFCMLDPSAPDPLKLARTYWDLSPRPWATEQTAGYDHPRTISDIFTSLQRANFRVDTILEPEPAADAVHSPYWSTTMAWVPATLLVRARKEGI
ncbi:MAG: methyltransferase domain-containing protein [Actinobacteria bacterium]|nr:methyltransferase domain-containing protein [Actinomycetota bacterium]